MVEIGTKIEFNYGAMRFLSHMTRDEALADVAMRKERKRCADILRTRAIIEANIFSGSSWIWGAAAAAIESEELIAIEKLKDAAGNYDAALGAELAELERTKEFKRLVDAIRLSPEQLAELIGIATSTIQCWASGDKQPPERIMKLLRLLANERMGR